MPRALALFGHPVSHSISPRLHQAFGQRTGIDLVYERRDTEPGTLRAALERFAAEGGIGGNVTLPLKAEAVECCTSLSERSREAGAVNTLKLEDAGWHGDNTDGAGFFRDLTVNLGFDPGDRRLLVVGAGGAAAGILTPLLRADPYTVVVANRTADGARALARRVDDPRVAGCGLELLADMSAFDLVVNATSAGHSGRAPELPAEVLREGAWCYDLTYGEPARPFLEWARRHGAGRVFDGRGMLVEQGAESFEVWFGVRPDTTGLVDELLL
jgi:shikimate dehydrogenase